MLRQFALCLIALSHLLLAQSGGGTRFLATSPQGRLELAKYREVAGKLKSAGLPPFIEWGTWADVHRSGMRYHGNAYFFVWHRAYLTLTEAYLSRIHQLLHPGSSFRMPYWDLVNSPQIPPEFCVAGSPLSTGRTSCVNVNAPRWPFAVVEKSLFAQPDSLMCILPFASGPPLNEVIHDSVAGTNLLGGMIEKYLHDPFHGQIVGIKNKEVSAKDPLFHALHAGVDRIFAKFLTKASTGPNAARIKCELCSEKLAGSPLTPWSGMQFEFPDTRCLDGLSYNASTDQFSYKSSRPACNLVDGALPVRKISIREILADPHNEFWSTRYDDAQLAAPCAGATASCGALGCNLPVSPTIVSLASRGVSAAGTLDFDGSTHPLAFLSVRRVLRNIRLTHSTLLDGEIVLENFPTDISQQLTLALKTNAGDVPAAALEFANDAGHIHITSTRIFPAAIPVIQNEYRKRKRLTLTLRSDNPSYKLPQEARATLYLYLKR